MNKPTYKRVIWHNLKRETTTTQNTSDTTWPFVSLTTQLCYAPRGAATSHTHTHTHTLTHPHTCTAFKLNRTHTHTRCVHLVCTYVEVLVLTKTLIINSLHSLWSDVRYLWIVSYWGMSLTLHDILYMYWMNVLFTLHRQMYKSGLRLRTQSCKTLKVSFI